MWTQYLIGSGSITYVGITKTETENRRLRQHNREIVGGARSTKRCSNWQHICLIRGFRSRSEVQRFESLIKRCRRRSGRKGSGPWNGARAMWVHLNDWALHDPTLLETIQFVKCPGLAILANRSDDFYRAQV